ncbi:ribosome biogenesis protein BOP1 homolog [Ipomoea triloba]|uniref:ribosome biogenesis protein BOP1 homolog n=1 Tax=Ipomoea triloba TaxID=35885 RepID=UPI00125DF208|nr:ribosome biogenesis protein BOP1 homolog [Ipomoea triloba]XP_031097579.1 ribosome biogenesis protein BOP1 homolog [Ipomoea triloba]
MERQGLSYIPAPKPKLPEDEIKSYELMFEEDRTKFILKQFESLRSVPAYYKSVKVTSTYYYSNNVLLDDVAKLLMKNGVPNTASKVHVFFV